MYFRAKTQELYITLDDVLNETSFTSKDIQDKLGENFEDVIERDLSRDVYRYLHGQYRGFDNKEHVRILNALIFNNGNYQEALKWAMVEHVKGAIYSGMDLNSYATGITITPSGKVVSTTKDMSDNVMWELKNGGLLDLTGDLQIDDELLNDIELRYPNSDTVLDVWETAKPKKINWLKPI